MTTPKLVLCDCGGSQKIDREALGKATGLACTRVHSALCTRELDRAAKFLTEGETIIACQQEADTFAALAGEIGAEPPLCVDIRDRAGWSEDAGPATPKMAALLAAALVEAQPEKTMDVQSDGVCLIVGPVDAALSLAGQLSTRLTVTCLVPDAGEVLPEVTRSFDIVEGRLRSATGALGDFEVRIDGFRQLRPEGRGPLSFTPPVDGAQSECDVIVDISGETPAFPAHHKRDGYLRADPGDPLAVQRAGMEASDLVGTFEKSMHVALEESLCAHSRAEKTGCTRCLSVCPTGAIIPDGDHVSVDPRICAGCGACSSVCPSGAISFDAPRVEDTMTRVRRMAEAYLAAGGRAPRLLLHDDHGREMIALAARLGRGLPEDVLPLELPSIAAFGHAECLSALAGGFTTVFYLPGPRTEREILVSETGITQAVLSGAGHPEARVSLLDAADPDQLSDMLFGHSALPIETDPILPLGRRRDVTRLAARALAGDADLDPLPLPDGAPYGAVIVDTSACTLCLACAGLCPSGALDDNPDRPELRFKEDACLQCGICASVCPEDAITLAPRLDLSDNALNLTVLKEEDPFACIECGALFGVRSTVERIVEKLQGNHAMFTASDNVRLIQMCDDCRVKAQFHTEAAPFKSADRPRPRTTDDYLDS